LPIADGLQMQLGKSALGIDTIIGKDFIPENESISINIGPSSPHNLISFMPGEKNREILDMALSYLIPMDTEIDIDLITASDYQESVLSDDGENVFLGYTVFL